MEKTIKINGSIDEMEEIFNNSKSISIRYYKQLKQDRFEVIIRFAEHLETSITKIKTIRELIKIDTFEISHEKSTTKQNKKLRWQK